MGRSIQEYIDESHKTAVEHGWWENERSVGDQFANFHAEISEAWEEYRKHGMVPTIPIGYPLDHEIDQYGFLYYQTADGDPTTNPVFESDDERDGTLNKPEGIAAELADVLIRIFDTCGRYNIPLELAMEHKMAFNKTRPYRHGGKKA